MLPEVSAAYRLYRQPNPFDGPQDFDRFTRRSHDLVRRLSRSLEYFGTALGHLKAAESTVAPHGKQELRYIINKIESHQMLFRTLITLREAYIGLDEAFRLRPNLPRAQFAAKLDAALGLFHQGRLLGRQTTETFAAVIDHPSDLGVLYRANLFLITGLELVEATIENIVNFHRGRPYTQPVAWDRIYREFPRFDPPY